MENLHQNLQDLPFEGSREREQGNREKVVYVEIQEVDFLVGERNLDQALQSYLNKKKIKITILDDHICKVDEQFLPVFHNTLDETYYY
jgi:hypothetical protein